MNKKIKLSVLTGAFLLVSCLVHAGPVISGGGAGDLTVYSICQNQESEFVIRGTAVPTFKQGLLQDEEGHVIAKFACKPDTTHVIEKLPRGVKVIWSCREYPFHEGNMLVRVESSRQTGIVSAYISRMQTHPLPPQALSTLNCNSASR